MECHACGRTVNRADRFCNGCGASLQDQAGEPGTTGDDPADSAAPIDVAIEPAGADDDTDAADSDPIATENSGDAPDTDAPIATGALPRTELVAATGGELPDDDPPWAPTGSVPAAAAATTTASAPSAAIHGFRPGRRSPIASLIDAKNNTMPSAPAAMSSQ